MARYQYYKDSKNRTICVSHYAGKVVRGVAKCAPEDTFDEQIGRDLARARCDAAVAQLRLKRAEDKLYEKRSAIDKLIAQERKCREYVMDAMGKYLDACDDLVEVEEKIDGLNWKN